MDPIKPNLKPPGTKRLKLNCDVLLSTSALEFNLRRYNVAKTNVGSFEAPTIIGDRVTVVGRCSLTQ